MPRPRDLKNKVIILGIKIDDQPMNWVLQKVEQFLYSENQHKIFTPNPEICLKAEKDERYRDALNESDINTPDGIGLKFGAKILGQDIQNRVAGSDLTKELLTLANTKKLKIYLALRDDSLTKKANLKTLFQKYPEIQFETGTVKKDNYDNCDAVLNAINDFKPQLLFVTFGAPNQELWINKYLPLLPSVKVALGVGGSFDFLTGQIKRAPKVMQKAGMEWLYRLYQEPQRLSRIKNATADFLIVCHKWKRRIKETYRINVVGVIKNKQGNYLLQKSAYLKNHWQFSQGGVDEGETPEQTVIREASEELGADEKHFRIIKKLPAQHNYDWLEHYQWLRGYKGQSQTAYLLEFSGTDKDFDLNKSREVEQIKWIKKDDILKNLHPVRRTFARLLIKYL